jgi:hypothetical protein
MYRDPVHLVSLGRIGFVSTPYDWVPVAVIVVGILLIFVRVYVIGNRSRSRSGRRVERQTVHRDGHVPERGEEHAHPAGHPARNHGHHSEPKRRTRHR